MRHSQKLWRVKKVDKNHNQVDDRLDWFTNACSVILPFTTIHQLYLIYVERQVDGVSGITWLLYAVLSVPLFLYSWQRKDPPMIVLNGLWVLVDALVWLGVVLYA